jgi:hypothetical protein
MSLICIVGEINPKSFLGGKMVSSLPAGQTENAAKMAK